MRWKLCKNSPSPSSPPFKGGDGTLSPVWERAMVRGIKIKAKYDRARI